MIKDYFSLAYRSAEKRRLRSWLTMIGIFIGIAAVVALVSLSQGLQTAIEDQFAVLGSDKLTVQSAETGFGPPGVDVTNPLTESDKKTISKINGVDMVVGRLLRSVRLEFKDEVKYGYVASMPEENEEVKLVIEVMDYEIASGRLLKKSDKFKVMIGSGFDDFFDEKLEIRDKVLIENAEFEVVGVLAQSGSPIKDNVLTVPESALREILDLGDEYDIIPLRVTSEEEISLVESRINKELRKNHNVEEGKEDFTVETPGSIMDTLNQILMIVQGVLVGIALISLLVGGIGIMNTMYTAVLERRKEIGLFKATGARNGQILFLFLVESGFLGLFGGLIGVSLGIGISKLVEIVAFKMYGSYLIRAHFNLWVVVTMLVFAFVVGALSGVLPARQAAKMKPVDALRG